MTKLTRKAAVTKGSLMTFLAPKLAQDAKIDLNPLLAGLTNKNFAATRPALLAGITALVKDKLAKDAELDHLPELLEALEHEEEEEATDNELEGGKEERSGMLPGLDAGREFLQGKLSAEDLKTYDEMCAGGAHDETPEEKAAKEKAEKEAKDKKARDEAGEKEREEADRKAAMDAAIKTAINTERDRQTAIREAEKAFRPYIGEMAPPSGVAFDSAEAVYQHGLKAMGVKTKLDNLPLAAFQAILEAQPRPGSQLKQTNSVAMDAAASKSFSEMFGTTHMPNII